MARWQWITLGVVALLLLRVKPVFAVKPGAILSTKPETEQMRRVMAAIWKSHGYQLTVTSGYDSTHGALSKHYGGLAEDYRTRDVAPSDLAVMVAEARRQLGRNYDLVIESDHLHGEFDPK